MLDVDAFEPEASDSLALGSGQSRPVCVPLDERPCDLTCTLRMAAYELVLE